MIDAKFVFPVLDLLIFKKRNHTLLIDLVFKFCYNAIHYGRVAQLVRVHGSHP